MRIWEVKQQKNVATFTEHTRPITAIAFSENGYHMASAAEDGVKLWDLRKLKCFKWVFSVCDCVCVCVRARACVRACACVSVCSARTDFGGGTSLLQGA